MTSDEFAKTYADRSGRTLEELLRYRHVEPCTCGDEICEGWAMIPNEYLHPLMSVTANEFKYEGS